MNRIDRLTAILVQLQGKKVVKAQEIADRFEISLRTVYRDVKALMEAGVPIGAEAGTGYYIVEGYHLPPIMFNRTEAAALLTGEKLMEKHSDHSNQQQFSNAMQKIRAVLRGTDKDFLESLDDNIAVIKSRPNNVGEEFPNRFLSEIQDALARQKVLSLDYYSHYNATSARRDIEPIGIFHMHNSWHLIGYCRLRQDYRDFRADRIKSLSVTDQTFNKNGRMSLQEFIAKGHKENEEKLTEVKVRFSHDVARFLTEQKYYYGFVQEKTEEQFIEMTFLYGSLPCIARWLLMLGNKATIISPVDMKDIMQVKIKELLAHHC
ncbi:WYL domain-containing protein [Chitinophaga sp. SYP-B3965]|uniref:helix-turn-helix transcriptional regulator n=1 Tax=Chitinophaga sp. SYP-B3965 TaxID=2663120 RepID=UPI00129951D4|nr:YafY family protein [Chitinophaga sp. SYP-B3965]MRG47638.1 WYL domain-containing protein [Chitinophaga sp. SYP-B3965]